MGTENIKRKKHTMTDTELLNKLEAILRSSSIGNGLALMPYVLSRTGQRRISFYDVFDVDSGSFGEELCDATTLRELIEKLELQR